MPHRAIYGTLGYAVSGSAGSPTPAVEVFTQCFVLAGKRGAPGQGVPLPLLRASDTRPRRSPASPPGLELMASADDVITGAAVAVSVATGAGVPPTPPHPRGRCGDAGAVARRLPALPAAPLQGAEAAGPVWLSLGARTVRVPGRWRGKLGARILGARPDPLVFLTITLASQHPHNPTPGTEPPVIGTLD